MDRVLDIAKKARENSKFIAAAGTEQKNRLLAGIAGGLVKNSGSIISANEIDKNNCIKDGISESLLDRLLLNGERIKKISDSIAKVINFTDPVGEVIFGYNLPNGLILKNIRVPLGVVGIIYEARPNVTVDTAVLCIKSGNSVILRGSSHAINTNIELTRIMRNELKKNGFPEEIIQIIPTSGREDALRLMELREYVDVLIPRGGKNLIDSVVENSKVPVIETGIGNCHIYIDCDTKDIGVDGIVGIVVNAKTQRPGVCNAAEKLLIHRDAAKDILPSIVGSLIEKGVKLIGDSASREISPSIGKAAEGDWYEEFLDLKMGVRIVNSIEDAVEHINKYGSGHTETIITSNYKNALYFTGAVDSSTVFVNASTRFTDGEEFGLGAEVGISTQKLHWRGPMGLRELTTNKFIVYGQGHIRT